MGSIKSPSYEDPFPDVAKKLDYTPDDIRCQNDDITPNGVRNADTTVVIRISTHIRKDFSTIVFVGLRTNC